MAQVDDVAGTAGTEVDWENTADEAWAQRALDFYQRRQMQVQSFNTEGVVSAQVWGTCPRCGHDLDTQMTISTPIVGLREGRGLWAEWTRRDIPTTPGIPDPVE